MNRTVQALAAILSIAALASESPEPNPGWSVELLAQTSLAPDAAGGDRPFGGISGLAYDPAADRWLAVSDHNRRPRLYRLAVTLTDHNAGPNLEIAVEKEIPLPAEPTDAEAIAPAPGGGWIVAYEAPPTIARLDDNFALTEKFQQADPVGRRLQRNRAWEAIAVARPSRPGESEEEAVARLAQPSESGEKAPAQPGRPGERLLAVSELGPPDHAAPRSAWRPLAIQLDPATGALEAQGRYRLSRPPGLGVTGLAELTALPDGRLLALERSLTVPRLYDARLFLLRADQRGESLNFDKTELASIRGLGVDQPGNLEAMAVGPELETGGRLLLLISDNNFGRDGQPATRAIALRLTRAHRD